MAQRTVITLVDDLDGSEAVETIEFALDGVTYQIELNAKNAKKLRTGMAPFVDKGRRVTATRKSNGTRGR